MVIFYRIQIEKKESQVSIEKNDQTTISLEKRYKEFNDFHKDLEKQHKNVPKLPEKTIFLI